MAALESWGEAFGKRIIWGRNKKARNRCRREVFSGKFSGNPLPWARSVDIVAKDTGVGLNKGPIQNPLPLAYAHMYTLVVVFIYKYCMCVGSESILHLLLFILYIVIINLFIVNNLFIINDVALCCCSFHMGRGVSKRLLWNDFKLVKVRRKLVKMDFYLYSTPTISCFLQVSD